MELVFVADVGPALAADGVDGVLVEAACTSKMPSGRSRRRVDRAGAACFEAGFVKVGIGVGVEELVGELRMGWAYRPRGSG